MIPSSILSTCDGLQHGLVSNVLKREEDSTRAGGYNYITATTQMVQGASAFTAVNKTMQAIGKSPLSSVRNVVILTPLLLLISHGTTIAPARAQPLIKFLTHHYGTLCQVANVASSVSLLFLGQPFFAASSLLMLGIGAMDRTGVLPSPARRLLCEYSPILASVAILVSGSIPLKIFIAANLLSRCVNAYLSKKDLLEGNFKTEGNLTLEHVEKFLNRNAQLAVNKNFIYHHIKPEVPHVAIHSLLDLFDEIDWQRHITTLRSKLAKDTHFQEHHHAPPSNEETIAFARASLKTCLDEIHKQRILNGEPKSYDQLIHYLKMIAYALQNQDIDDTTKTDILFRLAVDAGGYCGPGKFEAIEEIYAGIVTSQKDIPLPEKVFHIFQNERKQWMMIGLSTLAQWVSCIRPKNEPFNKALGLTDNDLLDVHSFNAFVNLYGQRLGLKKSSADHDEVAKVHSIFKLIVSKLALHFFWEEHTPSQLTLILNESIGTSILGKPEFYQFWQQWIDRLQISDEEKEQLTAELEETSLFQYSIEVGGKIHPAWVALMLVEMGILQIK